MKWENLTRSNSDFKSKKLIKKYLKLESLIEVLKTKELPNEIVLNINNEIININSISGPEVAINKGTTKAIKVILNLIEQELGLITNHHYQNRYMIYGIIIGGLFSSISQALGYNDTKNVLPILISIGLIIGMLVGKNMDKVAKEQKKQLNF